MAPVQARISSPDVAGGFYTVSEAARLLRIHNPARIMRWLRPTPKGAAAVISRSYEKIGAEHELSFLDMMEVRFVEHFRAEKISLQSLRVAAQNARKELNVSHPFATSNVKFQSDRKAIFLHTAKETGDRVFLDLMTNQLALYEILESSLARDLEFDVSGFARLWKPAPNTAPDVIVSPVFAFGRPVISQRRVPTKILRDSFTAEGGNIDTVAKWHGVSPEEVLQAVDFETGSLH